jgi:twinkle protein
VSEYKPKISLEEIGTLPVRGFQDRRIPKVVCEHYGVKVAYGETGQIEKHYYPYDNGKAYKVRELPKNFTWVGKSQGLFGKDIFNGGGRKLIITEGEIDALSVAWAQYEKYNKFYPVVALSSATMAEKTLLAERDWIRSFQEVVLCFDEDDAGQEAREAAIRIIGLDKVKITKLPRKDPNEVLMNEGHAALLNCIFEATKYIPSGIIGRDALWEALVQYNNTPSVPYPPFLAGVNEKTKGTRPGEIALFVSGTSCGKSTIMREIGLHLKEVTPDKIGIVSLEEAPAETARKLSGMALHKNPAKEELSLEVLKEGFDQVFGDDRFILLDHQGSLKDETILDKIEYMALCGCKYIIIDHITILVSEGADGLTGNEAIDKVMNDLLRFVKRHNVWIGLVSHLRKTQTAGGKPFEGGKMPTLDDIKGSGSIKQISFDIIAFARNLQATSDVKRNTIDISVLKCRYTGLTGPCEGAYYNFDTGRFAGMEDRPIDTFVKLDSNGEEVTDDEDEGSLAY